jgi:hypothetical protein
MYFILYFRSSLLYINSSSCLLPNSKILRCNFPEWLVNFRQLLLLLIIPRTRKNIPTFLPPPSRCYVYPNRPILLIPLPWCSHSFHITISLYYRPGSSVGKARLRAGRSGDRIPVGARFSAPVQTGPGAHSASCTMDTGSFPGVKCGRSVLLTTHPLLVLRLWKNRAILLPTLWATPGL